MYTITSIVPFDMLVDTDMGLLKLIQKDYCNYEIFRKPVLEERNMDIMKLMLTRRDTYDPMFLFCNEGKENEVKDLYQEFLQTKYEEMLKYSCTTGIFEMVKRCKSMQDVTKFTIVCDNDLQKSHIKKLFKKYDMNQKITDISEIRLEDYGNIYIKRYENILDHKDITIEGKNILIGNYMFNMEQGIDSIPLRDVSEKVMVNNVIKIIDMYPLSEEKVSVG